jgi:hypothetical protein
MWKLVALLAVFMLAAAAAAGAGDKIKWSKSKKIEYVSPDEDSSSLSDDCHNVGLRYTVSWQPYTEPYIYSVDVTYYSWELFAAGINVRRNLGQCVGEDYETEVNTERNLHRKYLTFDVVMVIKSQSFYDESGKGYWKFYLMCGDEELEPINVQYFAYPPDSWYFGGYMIQFVPSRWLHYTHAFKAIFENPYWNEAEKRAEPPPSLKLVVSGEEATRGFEWRFKED